jgi:hypothetical protein
MIHKTAEIWWDGWNNEFTFYNYASYILKDDLVDPYNKIKDGIKPVGIADKETTYFSPLCKIPRYKIDDFINENKLTVPKTYTFNLAHKVILNKKNTLNLLNPKTYKRKYKVPVDDLKSFKINQRYHEGVSLTSKDVEYVLIPESTNANIPINLSKYPIIEIIIIDTGILEKEYKFLFDLYKAIDKYKFVVGEDDEVLKQTNKELVIDEDIYQSLRDMLLSRDYKNHQIARELIANCEYEQSRIYLLLLLHEFNRSLYGGQKTPNFAVFLDKFKEWRNVGKNENWFNYGIKLMKLYPANKQIIKKFMVVRFNKLAGQEVLTDMIFKDGH